MDTTLSLWTLHNFKSMQEYYLTSCLNKKSNDLQELKILIEKKIIHSFIWDYNYNTRSIL